MDMADPSSVSTRAANTRVASVKIVVAVFHAKRCDFNLTAVWGRWRWERFISDAMCNHKTKCTGSIVSLRAWAGSVTLRPGALV